MIVVAQYAIFKTMGPPTCHFARHAIDGQFHERHTRTVEGKRRATTKRLRNRELVLGRVLACWQLPTGERDQGFRNASLSMFRLRIFHSSVWRGMPSFAAAPRGPATLPCVSLSAASIMAFSPSASVLPVRPRLFVSHDSSITKVWPSLNTTARSITFWSSRTLPGQS